MNYHFDRFEVRLDERQFLIDGKPSVLGARAFDLLNALVERRNRVVGKAELLDTVWPGLVVEENNLQVQISTLRKLLGPQAIATVPGRGYRFTISLDEPAPSRSKSKFISEQATATIHEPPSIAVLAFVNRSKDPDDEYFADGLADELLNVLTKIRGLRVAARSSAFTFRNKGATVGEVGRALNVATVLEGSVRKAGNRLRISVQLVKVADGYSLWSERYDRTLEDIFAVQDDIAQSVVKELRSTLLGEAGDAQAATVASAQVTAAVKSRSTNAEAYRYYLKGREFLVGNQQVMDKSVDCFLQAIARAPEYALAHAGLAEAYATQAYLRAADRAKSAEKAQAAVNRALELDPHLAEAHTGLGLVRFYFEWDWVGAEVEFRQGLELNPGCVPVHEEYGRFLLAMGRLNEALAESTAAAELDPLSVGPVHDIAINALARCDFEGAAAGFRRTIEIDPNWTWGYIKLARTLATQGNYVEARVQAEIAERRIAGGVAPLSQSWLGVTYAICGDSARAREKLDYLHALERKQYVDPVTYAAIHSALGEMGEALRRFEQACEERTPNMVYAPFLPALSPELVGNLRYNAIIDRMGFAKAARFHETTPPLEAAYALGTSRGLR